MSTTTNLAEFGYQERKELIALLTEWNENGLPDDFDDSGVHPMFNKNSGNVFLTNDEYQVAMINSSTGKLESFYTSPYDGVEGFFSDLAKYDYDGMNDEDKEWLRGIAENLGREDELPSLEGEEDKDGEDGKEEDSNDPLDTILAR